MVIDQCLSGDTMANSVISKTLGKLKFLYRYKTCLDKTLRKNLCMALLQCHLDYCSTTWYPTLSSKLKNKLQTTQNKVVRYILNFNHRENVGQTELDSLNFLNINDRVEQLRLNHVFKIRQGLSPVYLSEGFTQISNTHRFQTRLISDNFFVPQVKGVESDAFYVIGVKNWNNLPTEVKNITNYYRFKRETKRFLANRALNRENSAFI